MSVQSSRATGRFAPSPTGNLHLGNLRTALAAHQMAKVNGDFLIRIEDLDRVTARVDLAQNQIQDLQSLGVWSDFPVSFQSDRFSIYFAHLNSLRDRGLVYECFCTRREIQEAVVAPHGEFQRYSGNCRDLSKNERSRRASERPAALRLRVEEGDAKNSLVSDIVLVRNDGVPAYNLAVVVDDELQGVTQVVRGEDLAHVTPSQNYLQRLLGFRKLEYVHLPLLVGPDGHRLSKRHGGVTLGDCLQLGFSAVAVRTALLTSLEVGTNGWDESSSLAQWLKSLL